LSKEETLDITVAQYVVCIGASTGGPALLPELIGLLNPDFKAAVIIVQHMPPKYTAIFANQLAQITKLKVSEAKNNETIKEKHIYVCPGDRNLLVERSKIRLVEIPENSIWQPSIDETFMSVADNYFNKCIGVILTGMGNDGVQGAALIKARGGKIICQSPDTAMISRMPESVINAGFADFILAPRVIIAKLNHWQKNKYKF